ncbi:MAG: MATE family efflux transporter [Candidatus Heteroscillospira sp.]|jgi:putative MATE family efflux protein
MIRDLTRGRPMKLILQFGVPILLGLLFQQMYNVVDTAIVGKTLGGNALAAVGSTGAINFLVVGFCIGICSGFAIPIAQRFGARDYKALRRYVIGSMWCTLFFAVAVTVLTLATCGYILRLMQTPEDIFDLAFTYIATIYAGLSGYMLYNMAAGILRSLGDSRTPVLWLVAASVVNVVLDLVFILKFNMGVFGAAFATILSQYMAGFGCLWKLCRGFEVLRFTPEDWKWDWHKIGHLCALGLPMGLQYSITAIGSIMIQTAVNVLGTDFITATTAASKVSMFICCPFDAMGSTMATYGGQNVGAGKWERLHQGVGACTVLGLAYSAIALVIVLFGGNALVMMFLDNKSAHLAPLAERYLITLVAFYFPLALVNIFRFMIQGMGFSPLATLAGALEMIGRGAVAYMVPWLGYSAACFASPAAWLLADAFLVPAYFYCYKKLIRLYSSGEK